MSNRGMFVDLSQWNAISVDWGAYKQWSAANDGISRVCLRSSYGNGYVDQHFKAYRAGAEAAGIDSILFYHYAYSQHNSPLAEANWQHSVLGPIRANDVIMLDAEEDVPQSTSEWMYQWLVQQQKNYPNNQLILYSYPAFISKHLQDSRLSAFPLILANWQYSPDENPPCPPPWTSYAYLQYTDKATQIPGVPGTVDANVYVGGITTDMPEKPLDISEVSQWFVQVNATTWQARDPKTHQPGVDANGQPLLVRSGILDYLRAGRSSDAQYGNFSRLGLPISNERGVQNGVAEQTFERAVIRWDPNKTTDNPPGVGQCYPIHLDPYYAAQQQAQTLQTQLQQCQTTLKVTGQQLAQAQAALSSGGDYGKACNDIADRLKSLPRYPTTTPQGGKKP